MSVDKGNGGALPSLTEAGTAEVLGVPEGKKKDKTNVNRLFVLIAGLAGIVFVVFGVLWFLKAKANAPKTNKPKVTLAAPKFTEKNQEVESKSIEKQKAEIKAREAEDEAKRAEALERDANLLQEKSGKDKRFSGQPGGTDSGANTKGTTQGNNAQGKGNNGAQGTSGAQTAPKPTPGQRKLSGPVLVDFSGKNAGADVGAVAGQAGLSGQAGQAGPVSVAVGNRGPGPSPDSLGGRLQPTILEGRSAGMLPALDYLLKRGMAIPCALSGGIDTTLGGFVRCSVISDVYSANNKTLLVERGATVFGEQQVSLKQGQARVFILWTRIDNPSGVFANLDSPGVDQIGANGVPGEVDTHFWQRFGGAIMLSLISDFSENLANRQGGGNTNNGPTYSNTQKSATDLATEALRNSINIPPTLVVPAGTVVNVLVARDVSFQNLYELQK